MTVIDIPREPEFIPSLINEIDDYILEYEKEIMRVLTKGKLPPELQDMVLDFVKRPFIYQDPLEIVYSAGKIAKIGNRHAISSSMVYNQSMYEHPMLDIAILYNNIYDIRRVLGTSEVTHFNDQIYWTPLGKIMGIDIYPQIVYLLFKYFRYYRDNVLDPYVFNIAWKYKHVQLMEICLSRFIKLFHPASIIIISENMEFSSKVKEMIRKRIDIGEVSIFRYLVKEIQKTPAANISSIMPNVFDINNNGYVAAVIWYYMENYKYKSILYTFNNKCLKRWRPKTCQKLLDKFINNQF